MEVGRVIFNNRPTLVTFYINRNEPRIVLTDCETNRQREAVIPIEKLIKLSKIKEVI